MAYFDELLQRAITVRNNRAPASNTADLVGGVLVGIVTALQMLLDDKQDELTFDTTPTADSPNPVTSDGIYQALQAIDLSACEKIANKVTTINEESTDTEYPSAKCVYEAIQAGGGGGQQTVKQATIFFSSSMLTKTMPNALSEFTITTLLAANVTSAYYSLSSGATHQLLTFVNGSIEGVEIVVSAGGWIRFENVVLTDNSESGSIAFKCGEEESADRQLSVFLNEALECKTVPNALGAYTISEIHGYNVSTGYYSLSSGASHVELTFTNGVADNLNIVVPAGGWIRFEDVGRTVYNSEASLGVKYTI